MEPSQEWIQPIGNAIGVVGRAVLHRMPRCLLCEGPRSAPLAPHVGARFPTGLATFNVRRPTQAQRIDRGRRPQGGKPNKVRSIKSMVRVGSLALFPCLFVCLPGRGLDPSSPPLALAYRLSEYTYVLFDRRGWAVGCRRTAHTCTYMYLISFSIFLLKTQIHVSAAPRDILHQIYPSQIIMHCLSYQDTAPRIGRSTNRGTID